MELKLKIIGGAELDLSSVLTHVAQQKGQLIFTHWDGAKHAINLPAPASPSYPKGLTDQIALLERQMTQQGTDIDAIKRQQGDLSHQVNSLDSVYTFKGSGVPAYPADARKAYFINLHTLPARVLEMNMPDLNLPDGTTYMLNNGDDNATVTLRPITGDAIDNGDHIDIPPHGFVLLVKSKKNWINTGAGYVPTALSDITNRIAQSLSAQLHTKDQILAMINNWFANPTTHGKLDQIITSLGYEKKTQPQPHPSSIVVHYGTGQGYPTDFTGETGHYAPHVALVVNHLDQTPAKVWIAVPESVASKVTGIVADGGLPAQWDNQTKTIDGEQWRVFISPYQFHSQTIKFTLNWSI